MEFNWEDFENYKIAVNCKTKESAEKFINECYKHGFKWSFSDPDETNWRWYKDNTYYVASQSYLSYGDINDGYLTLPVVEYKEDNKMELKEGMIIECRNGGRYLLRNVCHNLIASRTYAWFSINYDKNFNDVDKEEEFDIMKIYTSHSKTLNGMFDDSELTCIWERKEPKKMTLEEISKALGYEVEIVE